MYHDGLVHYLLLFCYCFCHQTIIQLFQRCIYMHVCCVFKHIAAWGVNAA